MIVAAHVCDKCVYAHTLIKNESRAVNDKLGASFNSLATKGNYNQIRTHTRTHRMRKRERYKQIITKGRRLEKK